MTLTALIPTLRQTLPDPLYPAAWPAGTTAVPGDVLLNDGTSLRDRAMRAGIPFLHDAAAHGVAVGRVTARVDSCGWADLVLDVPDEPEYCWSEARLLGRVSTVRAGRVRLSTPNRHLAARCALPEDTGIGDLIAVPRVRA